jgi:N-lysine methyltransferase SETD6
MFWNEEELAQLKGTEVLPRIGKQNSEAQYSQILLPLIKSNPNLFDPKKCGIDAFHRMGSLVLAYSFGRTDEDDESATADIAMVPLADMLNANPELNNVTCNISRLTVGAIISS